MPQDNEFVISIFHEMKLSLDVQCEETKCVQQIVAVSLEIAERSISLTSEFDFMESIYLTARWLGRINNDREITDDVKKVMKNGLSEILKNLKVEYSKKYEIPVSDVASKVTSYMRTRVNLPCAFCNSWIEYADNFCGHCGNPTKFEI